MNTGNDVSRTQKNELRTAFTNTCISYDKIKNRPYHSYYYVDLLNMGLTFAGVPTYPTRKKHSNDSPTPTRNTTLTPRYIPGIP